MEKKLLIVSADQFAVTVLDHKEVAVHFRSAALSLELIDTDLVLRLAPNEARLLAQVLIRKADEAEAG